MRIRLTTRWVGPQDAKLVREGELLRFYDRSWEPLMTVNVLLPDEPLEDGEILVKDYSENEGLLACLVKEGVVEDTGRRIPSGFVELPVCKLLVDI